MKRFPRYSRQIWITVLALSMVLPLMRHVCSADGDPGGVAQTASAASILDHKPGVRPVKANAVTIKDVRSNKVLYSEGEHATTMATVANTSLDSGAKGMLIALMHLDVDTEREISRVPFEVGSGETKHWSFSYDVGPETYGRAVEVRFEDENGKLVDSWSEFFSVAAEYFRVHMHCYNAANELYEISPWTTYMNQRHYFAAEPTDFGVQLHDSEKYVSGQGGSKWFKEGKKNEIAFYKSMGINNSFYQNWAFSGQMGYEEMRKHPEYVLYDPNGQFAVDPIYGSNPNPMDLASPIEIGPKRQAKPHLDREYKPWPHTAANCAPEEAVVYEAECIRDYTPYYGFTGVFFDGTIGVLKGYGYDGVLNITSEKPEDFARLNARNHRIYSTILKKDNPNFGTWYNWSFDNIEPVIKVYGQGSWIGSGSGSDVDFGDESIRAATNWKNVMLLRETGAFYEKRFAPSTFLTMLINQRDWAVQKYEANAMVGYSDTRLKAEEPGPTKWGWPAVNYICAQMIATQMHFVDSFMPSHRPTLQFMTRYSRLLWSPDIKVVPDEEKLVQVSSPEEIFWKRLVYRRETKEGYDLIMHLVRIPPSEKFDINLAEEPVPLEGVKVSVNPPGGVIRDVQAMRPYYFEEEQQPVHTAINARVEGEKVSIQVPPFRYHMMVVFRFSK